MSIGADGRNYPRSGVVLSRRRSSQPQVATSINRNSPLGNRRWNAIHIPGVALFGDASPSGTFGSNTSIGAGPGGRALIQSGTSAAAGFNYGTNARLQLNVSSGVIVARYIAAGGPLYNTSSLSNGTHGFFVGFGGGNVSLVHFDTVALVTSSNSVALGEVANIAWSYNSTTGRAKIAVNGVLTSATVAASLGHSEVSSGGYYSSLGAGTYPTEQYLLAVSPDECFDDAALISASQNPWQLFTPIRSNALALTPTKHVWTPRQTRMLGTSSGTRATTAIIGLEKKSRTKQPQEAVGANSEQSSLVSLYNGATDTIWVKGRLIHVGSGGRTRSYSAVGAGPYYPGSGVPLSLPDGSLTHNGPFSRLALVKWNSGRGTISAAAQANSCALEVQFDGKLNLTAEDAADAVTSAAGVAISGEPFIFGASWDGATAKLYKNGVQVASASYTYGFPYSGSAALFGEHLGGVYKWNGDIYAHADFNKALTATEFRQYSDNIWQLFTPRKSPIWTPYP